MRRFLIHFRSAVFIDTQRFHKIQNDYLSKIKFNFQAQVVSPGFLSDCILLLAMHDNGFSTRRFRVYEMPQLIRSIDFSRKQNQLFEFSRALENLRYSSNLKIWILNSTPSHNQDGMEDALHNNLLNISFYLFCVHRSVDLHQRNE